MSSSHPLLALPVATLVMFALPVASAGAQTPEGVQRVLLLVVGNDGPASVRRAERAFQQELESRQLEVVLQREPEHRPGELPVVDTCISGNCLAHRLEDAHAQLFLGMGVWLHRAQAQISLTLDDGHGPIDVSDQLEPDESDAHFARRLLDLALQRYHGRRGVPLRVNGTPRGASVVIDHRPRGQLPLATRLQPGPHDITVAHVDYTTGRRHIELGLDGAEVDFALEREPDDGASTHADDAQAVSAHAAHTSSHPIVGPVLLFAAAAAGIAGASYGLTRSGCLEPNAAGECLRQREAPTAGIAIGFGGAGVALSAGLIWLFVGGSQAQTSALHFNLGPRHAGLDLQVAF